MIERQITIGLITSTEYLQEIHPLWNERYLKTGVAKRICSWCIEYFEKYHKAPNKDIEGIYYEKLAQPPGIPDDVAEEIEEDILPDLSEEYEEEGFNLEYLLDQTRKYFKERALLVFQEDIKAKVQEGDLTGAERLAINFRPNISKLGNVIDLSDESFLEEIDKAFDTVYDPVIRFPRALGDFWNDQLVRGAFIGFMASEKRGKTYWLMELAMQAYKQKKKVAFFQAGDMTKGQQIIRLSVYLAGRSNLKRYCKAHYQTVRDCMLNQTDECSKSERDCKFGVFEGCSPDKIAKYTLGDLTEAYKDNSDYTPCMACTNDFEPVPWVERVEACSPLTKDEAKEGAEKFFIQNQRSFKLASYANGTLSMSEIEGLLGIWEREEDFLPDAIIIDYADLLVPDKGFDFRHGQNEIWKGMRRLSQRQHSLVATATQADADSYKQGRLYLNNFSEDKRKYGHVTAMYGLNQDPFGREKKLGLMRINELVIREGEFSNTREVTVLQNLKRGRPFRGSYW